MAWMMNKKGLKGRQQERPFGGIGTPSTLISICSDQIRRGRTVLLILKEFSVQRRMTTTTTCGRRRRRNFIDDIKESSRSAAAAAAAAMLHLSVIRIDFDPPCTKNLN